MIRTLLALQYSISASQCSPATSVKPGMAKRGEGESQQGTRCLSTLAGPFMGAKSVARSHTRGLGNSEMVPVARQPFSKVAPHETGTTAKAVGASGDAALNFKASLGILSGAIHLASTVAKTWKTPASASAATQGEAADTSKTQKMSPTGGTRLEYTAGQCGGEQSSEGQTVGRGRPLPTADANRQIGEAATCGKPMDADLAVRQTAPTGMRMATKDAVTSGGEKPQAACPVTPVNRPKDKWIGISPAIPSFNLPALPHNESRAGRQRSMAVTLVDGERSQAPSRGEGNPKVPTTQQALPTVPHVGFPRVVPISPSGGHSFSFAVAIQHKPITAI